MLARCRQKNSGWGHPFGLRLRMVGMDPRDIHAAPREPAPGKVAEQDLDRLLAWVARGDEAAFETV
jgi:hypothetical protein